MATNLAIDDKLLILAQGIAGIKTKKDTVNLALKEFIQRRKQEGESAYIPREQTQLKF